MIVEEKERVTDQKAKRAGEKKRGAGERAYLYCSQASAKEFSPTAPRRFRRHAKSIWPLIHLIGWFYPITCKLSFMAHSLLSKRA